MSPTHNDRLIPMRDAAQAAISILGGNSRNDLSADLMLRFVLLKALEIIGEAATNLAPEFRDAHSEIPWKAIIGMRNRLVHGYFNVDLDVMRLTVTERLPALVIALEPIIAATSPPDAPASE